MKKVQQRHSQSVGPFIQLVPGIPLPERARERPIMIVVSERIRRVTKGESMAVTSNQ
jgi:hypothetical protein